MVLNNNLANKTAKLLADEVIATAWNIALGDDNSTTASASNTDMDNEFTRDTATYNSNGNTLKLNMSFNGFDSAYEGEVIEESGVFDKAVDGELQFRDTDFTPVTVDGFGLYDVVNFGEVSQELNTVGTIITDVAITNILTGLAGTTTDFPTHIGFSTRLILDTFNVTTDWNATGGALSTSTNKQEGTNSLALTKTSGSTVVAIDKTISTVDVSDAETIRLWLRINTLTTLNTLTTTDCVEIRLGTDSSNYKYIKLDKADLTTVWKLLELAIGDFSDVGSPDMSDIQYLYISFTTNLTTDVWTGEELLLDFYSADWQINKEDVALHEEVVRKAISTVERNETQIKYVGALATGEGNTYNYYYLGMFDAASSGDMFLVNSLLLTSKDVTKQINFNVELGVKLI